jgi:hypothetical protein
MCRQVWRSLNLRCVDKARLHHGCRNRICTACVADENMIGCGALGRDRQRPRRGDFGWSLRTESLSASLLTERTDPGQQGFSPQRSHDGVQF